MVIKAYSKVNLIMNIKGKRPDGYHEVETLMQSFEPHDDVEVNTASGKGISLEIRSKKLNTPQNLAIRAARMMLDEFEKHCHVDIRIEKRIPVAAGLGGGSADAAAVITALARIWRIDDMERLLEIGAKLGSDVPFCIASCFGHRAAIGRGRGEILEYIEPLDMQIEIERLNYHIKDKTKTVYGELKAEDYAQQYDIDAFLKAKTIEEKEALMGNHLQAPAFRVFAAAGYELPEGPVHLSGAGPAIFRIVK